MKAVTIVQITPDELSTIIIDCVNACLRNDKTLQDIKEFILNNKVLTEQPDRWMDLIEVCNYIPDKPTKPTVYGWVHSNNIPFHKGGKKLRFLKSEIDNWLLSKFKQ